MVGRAASFRGTVTSFQKSVQIRIVVSGKRQLGDLFALTGAPVRNGAEPNIG